MSSVETPDDRDPPEFNFHQWSRAVAAMLAVILLFCAALAYFYEPPSPEQKIQSHRRTLEFICAGQTLRGMTEEDIEACRAAGIDWPPRKN